MQGHPESAQGAEGRGEFELGGSEFVRAVVVAGDQVCRVHLPVLTG